jgi:glucose-6-phosphate isomerase/transaldolase/glucose-6-phosphate isomerase
LFIQITSDGAQDLPIPDEPGSETSAMSFQTLKMSQALGDAAALEEAGRKLLRFHIRDITDLESLEK